jgi:hypothetical protein
MLKNILIIGSALIATSALYASVATAEEGISPISIFSGEGEVVSEPIFETETDKLKCNGKATITEGKFSTHQQGVANLTMFECKLDNVLAAQTLGASKEQIKMKISVLVCLVASSKLIFGLFFEPTETVHIEVPAVGQLLLLKGAVIGFITGGQFEIFLTLRGSKGKQTEEKQCTINGNTLKHSLELGSDTAKDKPASEMAEFKFRFPERVEFVDK